MVKTKTRIPNDNCITSTQLRMHNALYTLLITSIRFAGNPSHRTIIYTCNLLHYTADVFQNQTSSKDCKFIPPNCALRQINMNWFNLILKAIIPNLAHCLQNNQSGAGERIDISETRRNYRVHTTLHCIEICLP